MKYAEMIDDCRQARPAAVQAVICSVDRDRRTARIRCEGDTSKEDSEALIAIPHECMLSPGDRVVVAGAADGPAYIIGVLAEKKPRVLFTRDGSYARLGMSGDDSVIQLFSNNDELLVEYDCDDGSVRIVSGTKNLKISAPVGSITMQAAESLELEAESIQLHGNTRLGLSVNNGPGGTNSDLTMDSRQTQLSSEHLRLLGARSSVFFDELRLSGKVAVGNVLHAIVRTRRLETSARTIINKARDVFQTVENLSQLKAGRLKALIRSDCHVKSKNTVIKSDEDFKVKAEKINLG